jgi:hypothetical protein
MKHEESDTDHGSGFVVCNVGFADASKLWKFEDNYLIINEKSNRALSSTIIFVTINGIYYL